ncbi:MAG: hypothetical protein KDC37_05110 [Flavobacteriales bacterium]|nr:hypothetical protein [Flavobacteriales bacterium]
MELTSDDLELLGIKKNPDLIFLLDEEHKIRYYSRSSRNVLQLPESTLNTHFCELLHVDDYQKVCGRDLVHEKLWEGHCHIALFRFRQPKAPLWVQVRIRRLFADKKWLFVSARELDLVSDFERKILENEAALSDSETVGRTGSWWINIKTQENHWSPGNFNMYDLPATDKAPPLSYVFSRLHPDDVIAVRAAVEKVKNQQTQVDLQLRVKKLHEDGWRYMYTRIRPFVVGGELLEVKGVNFDITDVVETQLKLEEHNKLLAEQNATLRKYVQLNSHEVRSPLSNLLGLIEIMEAEPEAAKEYITHLHESAQRLDSVIRDINDTLSQTAYKHPTADNP